MRGSIVFHRGFLGLSELCAHRREWPNYARCKEKRLAYVTRQAAKAYQQAMVNNGSEKSIPGEESNLVVAAGVEPSQLAHDANLIQCPGRKLRWWPALISGARAKCGSTALVARGILVSTPALPAHQPAHSPSGPTTAFLSRRLVRILSTVSG